jgi:hypothetical protein
MVFNLYGTERLTEWKKFRDSLEDSRDPFQDVLDLWTKAPFVSSFLNPKDLSTWPDPWHLVLDNRLDNLAIILGILYTLKLTRRFMDSEYEIHMSIVDDKDPLYFLVIENRVLNYVYGSVTGLDSIKTQKSEIVWTGSSLP